MCVILIRLAPGGKNSNRLLAVSFRFVLSFPTSKWQIFITRKCHSVQNFCSKSNHNNLLEPSICLRCACNCFDFLVFIEKKLYCICANSYFDFGIFLEYFKIYEKQYNFACCICAKLIIIFVSFLKSQKTKLYKDSISAP